jgi:glycosyltransferase involved in cell wall biosynthesis
VTRSSAGEREIVFVWPYLEWGGVQTYFLGLMKRARREYRVSAVCPAGTSATLLGFLDAVGVPCTFSAAHAEMGPVHGARARLSRRWQIWRTQIALVRILVRKDLARSLFHCDLAPWMFFPALAYLALRGRVVVTLHTALPRLGTWRRWSWRVKFSTLCRLPGFQLLATNQDMLRSLRPFLSAKAIARVCIAPSAFDADDINAAAAAGREDDPRVDRLGLERDRFYVVTAGQFIERKGCWVLLDAARRLCAGDPDIAFLWCSTAPPSPADRTAIEAYGLGDRFRCVTAADFGPTRHDLLSFIRQGDVFALPSLEEGLPLALLEAMALGMPVVASRVNAIPEALDDGVHGLLVEPGNVDALVSAITRLRRDAALRARLAGRARTRAFEMFEQAAAAGPTLAAYASAWR